MGVKYSGDYVEISDEIFTDNGALSQALHIAELMARCPTSTVLHFTDQAIYFKNCTFKGVNFVHDSVDLMSYRFLDCYFDTVPMTFTEIDSVQFTCCNGIINFAACECRDLLFSGSNLKVRFNRCNIDRIVLLERDQKTSVKIDDFIQSCVNQTWVPEHKDAYEVIFPSDFEPRCPESGAFTAYKKGMDIIGIEEVLITLEVPEDAKRTSGLANKCRCEKAIVKSITGITSNKSYNWALSRFCPTVNDNLLYAVGQTVVPDYFDDNGLLTCSHGIHFFMTRAEAEEY